MYLSYVCPLKNHSLEYTQGTLNISATNRYMVEKAGLESELSDFILYTRV